MRAKSWLPEAGLVAALVAVTGAAAAGWTAGLDLAVRRWVFDHQVGWVESLAGLVNHLGQGWLLTWVLTGGLTLLLLVRTREPKVVLPGAAALLLTYATVGPLKLWTSRPAPRSPRPDAVELFRRPLSADEYLRYYGEPMAADEYLRSFPSGHVVNAIVWWTVIILLAGLLWRLPGRHVWWLRAAAPVVVLATTTYLGHHWLTDGLAALPLGLLSARLLGRVDWPSLLPSARPGSGTVRFGRRRATPG